MGVNEDGGDKSFDIFVHEFTMKFRANGVINEVLLLYWLAMRKGEQRDLIKESAHTATLYLLTLSFGSDLAQFLNTTSSSHLWEYNLIGIAKTILLCIASRKNLLFLSHTTIRVQCTWKCELFTKIHKSVCHGVNHYRQNSVKRVYCI